jgi:hypothetical protein
VGEVQDSDQEEPKKVLEMEERATLSRTDIVKEELTLTKMLRWETVTTLQPSTSPCNHLKFNCK